MGPVSERLEKLAAAGLPVAAIRYFASEDDLPEGDSEQGQSLRFEGARLRAASAIANDGVPTELPSAPSGGN